MENRISDVTVTNAVERLERAQFKLGRAQGKAIQSAAQANADRLELEACQKEAEEARADLEALVAKATAPVGSMEKAIEAVREKLIDHTPKIVGSIFKDGKAVGGRVLPGRAYLVGEKGPEAFVPKSGPVLEANGPGCPGDPEVAASVLVEKIDNAKSGDVVVDVLGIAQPLGPNGPKLEVLADRPILTQGGPELRDPMDWPESVNPPPMGKAREGDRWPDRVTGKVRTFKGGEWVPDEQPAASYWPDGDVELPKARHARPPFHFGDRSDGQE